MELDLGRVLGAMPAMVLTALPDGQIDFVNRRWSEFTGLDLEQACGSKWQDAVDPDDLPQMLEQWRSILASGEAGEMETRMRRFDGQDLRLLVQWNPLRDDARQVVKWCGVATDVDDLKRDREALRESERNAHSIVDALVIVDNIPALVSILTPSGGFEFLNRQTQDYTGKTLEELMNWGTADAVHPDDLAYTVERYANGIKSGEPFWIEYRMRRSDGVYRWFEGRHSPMKGPNGQVVRWFVTMTDIDDRKRAEEAAALSERNLKLTIDTIPAMAWSALPNGSADFFNQQYLDYMGLSAQQAKDWGWTSAVHPDDMSGLASNWQAMLASGLPGEAQARLRRSDGEYRWFLFRANPLRDGKGDILKWFGVNADIEDRKRAEETLRERERDLSLTINTIPVMAWSVRPDGSPEFFNQHYLHYVGLSIGQSQDWTPTTDLSEYWDLTAAVHPDDESRLAAKWRSILASGQSGEMEARVRRFDGTYRWFLFRANPLRDEAGDITKWYGTNTDIDDRKRAEEELRRSEAFLNQAQRLTLTGSLWWNVPTGEITWSDESFRLMQYPSTVKPSVELIMNRCHPEDLPLVQAAVARSAMEGVDMDFEHRLLMPDGSVKHIHLVVQRDELSGGSEFVGAVTDITARKKVEEELRRSEAFLAEGQHLARMGSLSWNVTKGEIVWSEPLCHIFEFEPGTAVTLELIGGRVHPDDMPLMADMVDRAQRGDSHFEYQHRIILPDHSVKYLHLIAHRAPSQSGQIEYIGAVLDITQRRLAEDALEKVRSELAQATRIMSLGVLTASIAHEVNQPLSGIVTNAGTCLRMLAADPPNVDGARETARRTIRDGNRAADVIARLRALFGNGTVAIEPVDLNEAAREVVALLWSDLQRSRIVLHTEFTNGLPPVAGDRVQLQQVILNLLRNAADAMSGVDDRARQLRINTQPGEDGHVRLSVRDAGAGFEPQGKERLFDAFYTTKSGGMGIGRSVSRSIIESHQGRLWAASNDGPGATFSFSIPEYSRDDRTVGDASSARARSSPASTSTQRRFHERN